MDSEQLLNDAVITGDLNILQWLAERAPMKFKRISPLITAVQFKRNDMIACLLRMKANPFSRVDGTTAFHVACSIGTPSQVRAMLLTPSVSINCTDTIGRTGLHLAVMDNTPIVQHILKCKNLRVNARDMFGKTALMYACKANAVSSVKALFARKARNDIASADGRYPIHFAANKLDILQLLPPKYVNHADAHGITPLKYATMYKNMEAMKYLISIGATVENATDLLGVLLRPNKSFPTNIAVTALWLVATYGASHRTLVRLAYSKGILPIIKKLAPKGIVPPMCTICHSVSDDLTRSKVIHYLTCQGIIDIGHLSTPSLYMESYALLASLLHESLVKGNMLVRLFTRRKPARLKRRRLPLQLNLDVLQHVAEFLGVVADKVRWTVLKTMLDWTAMVPEVVDLRF
jgi:ankyrin repeat protein